MRRSVMELSRKDKVVPVGQTLLVQIIPDSEKIHGSRLVKPKVAETKSCIGRIVGIGEGKQDTSYTGEWPPNHLKVGTHVIFNRFAGVELRLEDALEEEWPRIIDVTEVKGILER